MNLHATNITAQSDYLFLVLSQINKEFMCVGILPAYICSDHVHGWCLQRPERGPESSETGVI